MKRKLILSLRLIAVAVAVLVIAACKKSFLDQETVGLLTEKDAQTRKGAQQFLIGSYAALRGIGWEGGGTNWVFGSISGGEANKGSDAADQADIVPIQQYAQQSSNFYFNQKWRALYEGVARSNSTIRIATALTEADITEEEKNLIIAQAKFLRGFYHFEAKKMWNKIPFVDESVKPETSNVPNTEDAWPRIMTDLDSARQMLPATHTEVGRVNKWAAEAMYAKALLFQGKYAEALPIFNDVIENGVTTLGIKYGLAPSFHYLFNADFEDDATVQAESLFTYEASVNDGSGGNNGNFDNILNFPYDESGNAPGGCCGFFQPTFEFVNSFRTSAAGLPLLDKSYNLAANEVKNDQGVAKDAPFTPDQGNLDPRLDWTVGRRGIPYLDWGPHPGVSWIRLQAFGGPYAPKKMVYYKDQKGRLQDITNWASGLTAINYKFLRFADVLLMAAECEAEVGDIGKALEYVNMIRTRAAIPATWVQGANANYKISPYPAFASKEEALAAIRFERKLELGMEGHRFFDLVRWGIAEQEINAFLAYEKTKLPTSYGGAQFTVPKNNYFPIPQRQIDLQRVGDQSTLEQNEGY